MEELTTRIAKQILNKVRVIKSSLPVIGRGKKKAESRKKKSSSKSQVKKSGVKKTTSKKGKTTQVKKRAPKRAK